MLPPQVNGMIKGIERQQDALIAELYVGQITFGQFNVSMDRITGEFLRALSGIPQTAQSNPSQSDTPKSAAAISQRQKEADVKPIPPPTHTTRIALVIGNSHYQNLPKLTNSIADARAIADLLKQIGYDARLVLDASEQDVRREVRKFAGESVKADIALVFYAGHGAQVNGENYLLPVDIEIARTEADIQLIGFKVDDLVNSIRSTAKVVFLDACRDNPVLFKNLVQGRGAHSTGLAPTVSSNLEQVKPGGGVFIAYATDSGSIALDGQGEHSPFTQALLRNLRSPISIDDMFSLVTKEVRLVTKNMQRPYKYASLESIVCLTGNCSNQAVAIPAPEDVYQQVKRSETEELQVALQTKNVQTLEYYLDKYPDSPKRDGIVKEISNLRREQFKEWTLFEIGNQHFPQFLKLSSVEILGDKVAVLTKSLTDPSVTSIPGKQLPDNSYTEQLNVFDCKQPIMAMAETTIYSNSGEILYHYKWADPRFLDLSIGTTLAPGSVGLATQRIACHEDLRTPLVDKKQLATMDFASVASTVAGDGEMFYAPVANSMIGGNDREIVGLIKWHEDRKIVVPEGMSMPDTPSYRTTAERVQLKCAEAKGVILKSEFYDTANNLVFLSTADPSQAKWLDMSGNSPLAVLRRIACDSNEVKK